MSNQYFFYRKDGYLVRIHHEEIIYLETAGNYVKFYTKDTMYLIRTSLEEAIRQLPENYFIQLSRSHAVAMNQLKVIEKGYVTLFDVPDTIFKLNEKYKPAVMGGIRIIEVDEIDSTKKSGKRRGK